MELTDTNCGYCNQEFKFIINTDFLFEREFKNMTVKSCGCSHKSFWLLSDSNPQEEVFLGLGNPTYYKCKTIYNESIMSFRGDYRFLSNFHGVHITWKCKGYPLRQIFPDAESIYVFEKTSSETLKKVCLNHRISPGKKKSLGRISPVVDNWDEKKQDVMAKIIDAKFDEPIMKMRLLATGNKTIIEGNTWNDEFWGININTGTGENILGKILMDKRKRLFNGE